MKAIITRNDQTAVLELPTSRMELAGSLSRIGIRTPAHIIPCSDEEEDYIKVKLFGESDFENELTALVTPKDSLGSVNTTLDLYRELPQAQKEKLKAELSQNPPHSLSSLCHNVMDFQPKYVTEDYYFPLTVSVYEYNEYGDLDYDSDCELDGRFADNYADEIKAMFDAYTASDDTDMAEYFDGSNSAVAKIKSLKWDFESFDGVLFGRVRANGRGAPDRLSAAGTRVSPIRSDRVPGFSQSADFMKERASFVSKSKSLPCDRKRLTREAAADKVEVGQVCGVDNSRVIAKVFSFRSV